MNDLLQRARAVKLAIFDVDGVLTDGGLYYDANGECMKRFHVRGRGRASRIEKPFSHLTIVVREVAEKGEAA